MPSHLLVSLHAEIIYCCYQEKNNGEYYCFFFFRGRLLVGTFVALSFNLFTMLSIRNKPFAYVSEGMFFFIINKKFN